MALYISNLPNKAAFLMIDHEEWGHRLSRIVMLLAFMQVVNQDMVFLTASRVSLIVV